MLSMVQTYRPFVCLPSLKDRIAFRHAGLPRLSCELVGLRGGKSDWQAAINGQLSVEMAYPDLSVEERKIVPFGLAKPVQL